MWKLLTALSFLILAGVAGCNKPNDVATTEEVDDVSGKLLEAFQAHDGTKLKELMTPDHVSVTFYYKKPLSLDEQIAKLPELDYKQTT